ncbi:MAG: NUDIX domain-containing protein [Xanthomonadales bacterium]|nr:NUDIX domain-containing protein [Gammaproteobacteria bacterium]NNJ78108.1 NUDIX domain-containing protein [Xanthomonadales bacterium]NNL03728.1 NUDIX domain-containing protein [Xanthomonadales bacterium]
MQLGREEVSLEWLEVVDENDTVIGLERRGVIHARGLMHRSAQILVFNSKGNLFLQKRSTTKDEFPGLWDSSAAGHVNPGESYEDCARRELTEELGIESSVVLEPMFRIAASESTGWEHCAVFRCLYDGPLELQPDEIDEGEWLSPHEIDQKVDDSDTALTPAVRRIWRRVRARQ